MVVTHYEVLGIATSASQDQIKTAYRCLTRKWHPDRNKNDRENAAKKSSSINEAYRVLIDPEKRKQYDAQLSRPSRFSGRLFDDIREDQRPKSRYNERPRRSKSAYPEERDNQRYRPASSWQTPSYNIFSNDFIKNTPTSSFPSHRIYPDFNFQNIPNTQYRYGGDETNERETVVVKSKTPRNYARDCFDNTTKTTRNLQQNAAENSDKDSFSNRNQSAGVFSTPRNVDSPVECDQTQKRPNESNPFHRNVDNRSTFLAGNRVKETLTNFKMSHPQDSKYDNYRRVKTKSEGNGENRFSKQQSVPYNDSFNKRSDTTGTILIDKRQNYMPNYEENRYPYRLDNQSSSSSRIHKSVAENSTNSSELDENSRSKHGLANSKVPEEPKLNPNDGSGNNSNLRGTFLAGPRKPLPKSVIGIFRGSHVEPHRNSVNESYSAGTDRPRFELNL